MGRLLVCFLLHLLARDVISVVISSNKQHRVATNLRFSTFTELQVLRSKMACAGRCEEMGVECLTYSVTSLANGKVECRLSDQLQSSELVEAHEGSKIYQSLLLFLGIYRCIYCLHIFVIAFFREFTSLWH